MKRQWIPYIKEANLRKEAALPLIPLAIAAGKGLLAAGGAVAGKIGAGLAAAKAAGLAAGGAVAGKVGAGIASAKAAGTAFAATKTGGALIGAGKTAGTALNVATIGLMAKDVAGAVSGNKNNQQEEAVVNTDQTQNLNTSVPPSTTSTPPGN